MSITLEVGGEAYTREKALALRQKIIELRDGALDQGDMEWSVILSHEIGLMYAMINRVWPEAEGG